MVRATARQARGTRSRARTRRILAAGLTTLLVPIVTIAAAPQQAAAVSAVQDLASGVTPEQLAAALAGDNVEVVDVRYTGTDTAAGTFSGGADSIGFASGVVLSSGRVASQAEPIECASGVEGPNECESNTTAHVVPGDPDLDALIEGSGTTNDAVVLEFDFVPEFATVQFEYVFGSEEYNEYVGSFNDVFAFFVNGVNCATVPGTDTPVSVNNINLDVNSEHYRNNDLAAGAPLDTEMDGLTTVLACEATVVPGEANTLKIAIADAVDWSFDSAVFLRTGSLVSGTQLTGVLQAEGHDDAASLTVDPGTSVTAATQLEGASVTSATGSVTYEVYADPSCAVAVLSSDPLALGAEGSVPPYTFVAGTAPIGPGDYEIRAFYSGDEVNNASSIGCGDLSLTVTGEPPTDVDIEFEASSQSDPATVTAGNLVRQTYSGTNIGTDTATGVILDVSFPAGSVITSVVTSQGSCSVVAGNRLYCELGSIAPGGSVSITVVVQVPIGFTGTLVLAGTTGNDQTGLDVVAEPTAEVVAPAPGESFGWLPPGGSIRTGGTPSPTDPTVGVFTLPNSGPGAEIVLFELATPPAFCGGQPCVGNLVEVLPFEGYNDPTQAPRLELIYDKTIQGRGLRSDVYLQKDDLSATPTKVPECKAHPSWGPTKPPKHLKGLAKLFWVPDVRHLLSAVLSHWGLGPWSNYADPSPCVNRKWIDHAGDLHIEVLLLSGDPRLGRR